MEYLSDAVDTLIDTHCVSEDPGEWDVDALVKELVTYWPNEITVEAISEFEDADDIYDLVTADAKAYYEQHEEELGSEIIRDVERQVMLRIIDQRWREHLEEMDYLQEGINLRAMGQKDPLTEWQREGYEMFGGDDEGRRPGLREVRHARAGRPQRRAHADRAEPAADVERQPAHGWRHRHRSPRRSCRRARSPPKAYRPRRRRRSSRRSSRTNGPRRRATHRARVAAARSSRCATALPCEPGDLHHHA